MESNVGDGKSLIDFASIKPTGRAWVDHLPDEIFNQLWDALNTPTGIGAITTSNWCRSLGYTDSTPAKVKVITSRERRS